MAGNRPPAAFRPQKDLIAEETFEPKHLQEVLPLSVSGTGCGFGFSLAKSAKSICMARRALHPVYSLVSGNRHYRLDAEMPGYSCHNPISHRHSGNPMDSNINLLCIVGNLSFCVYKDCRSPGVLTANLRCRMKGKNAVGNVY
jgi:hypothetical protein